MTSTSKNYAELEDLLNRLGAPIGPSECHGFICAQLCTSAEPDSRSWRECLGAEGEEAEATLRRISDASGEDLASTEFTFEPMLPSEEATLAVRADALAAWCRGFLFGLGNGGLTEAGLSGDCRELVEDIERISRARVELEQGEEFALLELVEFVRVGAMTVFQELKPMRTPSQGQPSLH
ncbi:uncharacterized protein YgfB (UPF0149 family) [Methylohalomonas lacus]|uniref:Uncharacterized protein YgfB (UPF0149 family) n=1 Tax=Methylohalomonas lacus TaxID=398773 RepID=A0AAE3L4K8_9GAMM|nr:UPF0149 family protein [Methylohalomonas lacus]MCS3904013.1 uncharacterized protein YgfB (UPF0149 family) [Methylohalomonas lacus]